MDVSSDSSISIDESIFPDGMDPSIELQMQSEFQADIEKLYNEADNEIEEAFKNNSEDERIPDTSSSCKSDGDSTLNKTPTIRQSRKNKHRNRQKKNVYAKTDGSNLFAPDSTLNSNSSNDSTANVEQEDNKNEIENIAQCSPILSGDEGEFNKLLKEVKNLQSMTDSVKDEIQSKLQSSELKVQSLEKQLNEHDETDKLSQLQAKHEIVLEEMKWCHAEEILTYQDNINQLQLKLNVKVKEVEDLSLKYSELKEKCIRLQDEKSKWIDEISEELAAQKQCQVFLESGSIEEINRLRLLVKRLEEEKSNVEKENSLLKESFFKRWTRSLLHWQLRCLQTIIGPFTNF